jgi:PAS domain S-box-containing protein
VLVVEDLPSDAELMILRLEEEGFSADWRRVQEEPEFLAALETIPDVILSDWQLPRFSGLRALELARERAPEIPFLIVSGNIGEEAAIEALRRGADDYVLKDRMGRLGSAVRRAMESARLRAQQRVERQERERLATAIEQSGEAVLITDLDGRLLYVNGAFTTMTGYQPHEVLGQNPRMLQSGAHSPDFYRAMWQTLTAGGSWVTELVNRRKDGSLYTQLSTISPVRDHDGRISSYVQVAHDLTRERELEATASRLRDERRLVADTLATLEPGTTPTATALEICRRVVGLSGIAGVAIARFESDGSAAPLALVTADGTELPLDGVTAERGRQVRDRVAAGAFVEPWGPDRTGSWATLLAPFALRGLAHLPVRYAGEVVGVMSAGARDGDAVERLTASLATLSEFADLGGVVLGPALMEQSARASRRERIARIIADRRFHPIFQPIVDLRTAGIRGYEALTRFETGDPPNEVMAEAWEVGLGVELELATLRAAVEEARILPFGHWLDLNVSPQLVVQAPDLGVVVSADPTRPIVLEVTEHDHVEDYAVLRDAIKSMGRELRLAVDDAGAGQANFGHIVELRADFVKLDISLIRGIDTDIGRQALVVGMRHFARAAGCRLIAEGVETAAEATTAAALGTELGQGYLFGVPAPATYWATLGTRSMGGGPTSSPSQ